MLQKSTKEFVLLLAGQKDKNASLFLNRKE